MALTLITGPTAEPVSASELKAAQRVTHSAEDSLISIYIAAARQLCEGKLGRAIINQTWSQTLDEFPSGDDPIKLMMPKPSSITTFAYTDAAGDAQTLTGTDYTLVADKLPGYLYPTADTWPETEDIPNAVTITYVAGFGSSSASVPDDIRAWILLTAGFLFSQRESMATAGKLIELPNRFHDSLLDKWRVFGV
jgi:uncharacterized phiE125 gp8 family phage protein